MKIKEKILQELKEAQKSKNSMKVSALRLMKSAIDYKELEQKSDKPEEPKEGESQKKELDDSEVIKVLQKIANQRKESIESFRKANREDAAKKEEAELKIVESFLPTPLSKEEIEKKVEETIAELGLSSIKDMGRIMKTCMEKFKGEAVDGKVVSEIVRSKLN